jgi:acetyl esterase/lipase
VPASGVSPLAQGAGRVDVAKAVNATVTSEPVSLGLGTQLWLRPPAAPAGPVILATHGGGFVS